MRVNGRGSEIELDIVRQIHKQVETVKSAEEVRKDIERKTTETVQETSLSSEELQRILQEIKRKLDYMNRYLKIDIDDQLEIPVVKIFERDTNRLIRQIPPDYLLELMKRIDQMLGILLSERV